MRVSAFWLIHDCRSTSSSVRVDGEPRGVSPIVQDGAGGGSCTEGANGWRDEWRGPQQPKASRVIG